MRKINFDMRILKQLDHLEPEINAAIKTERGANCQFFSSRLIAGIWEDRMKTFRSAEYLRSDCGAEQIRRHLQAHGVSSDVMSASGDRITLANASYNLRGEGLYMTAEVDGCWAWSFSAGSPKVKTDAEHFVEFLLQFDEAIPKMKLAVNMFILEARKRSVAASL